MLYIDVGIWNVAWSNIAQFCISFLSKQAVTANSEVRSKMRGKYSEEESKSSTRKYLILTKA